MLDGAGPDGGGGVGVLDEESSDHGTDVAVGGRDLLEEAHEAEVLLLLKQGAGIGRELWGDDDLTKDLGDGAGKGLIDGAVRNDDAAEGGGPVGGEGLLPRLGEILVTADTAGVGVLEDGDGRLGKLGNQARGGGDVEDVVEGEFLAVELLEVVEESAVELSLLMGVLAVAEATGEGELEREGVAGGALVVEVGADGAVVGTGGGEGLHGEAGAELGRGLAATGAHGLEHAGIVVGVDDDGDGAVVLRSAADHGGTADVNLLDGLL